MAGFNVPSFSLGVLVGFGLGLVLIGFLLYDLSGRIREMERERGIDG